MNADIERYARNAAYYALRGKPHTSEEHEAALTAARAEIERLAASVRLVWNGVKIGGKLYKGWFTESRDREGREHVMFYRRGYESFPCPTGLPIENHSDSMRDYFDEDHARIYPDHPRYAEALAAAEAYETHCRKMTALRDRRRAERTAAWAAKSPEERQAIRREKERRQLARRLGIRLPRPGAQTPPPEC